MALPLLPRKYPLFLLIADPDTLLMRFMVHMGYVEYMRIGVEGYVGETTALSKR
jgi:hypothetical protein